MPEHNRAAYHWQLRGIGSKYARISSCDFGPATHRRSVLKCRTSRSDDCQRRIGFRVTSSQLKSGAPPASIGVGVKNARGHFIASRVSLEVQPNARTPEIFRVHSFGEERAIRRKMSRLCRFGVRSPNEKSVLLLGSIANKSARRMYCFGQAGGAKAIRTAGTNHLCQDHPPGRLLLNPTLGFEPAKPSASAQ